MKLAGSKLELLLAVPTSPGASEQTAKFTQGGKVEVEGGGRRWARGSHLLINYTLVISACEQVFQTTAERKKTPKNENTDSSIKSSVTTCRTVIREAASRQMSFTRGTLLPA